MLEIIDNTNRLLGDDLTSVITSNSKLKIAASCFSIYAYEALKKELFTMNQPNYNFENAKEVKKHIYNYLITDSKIEKNFAEELDASDEVVVYAKLPKGFFIPTPVGDYNPDWAVAFKEGSVQYIYFVAETKGSMSSLQMRKIEEIKIECAERFFDKLSTDNLKLKYSKIDNFDTLWKIVNGR